MAKRKTKKRSILDKLLSPKAKRKRKIKVIKVVRQKGLTREQVAKRLAENRRRTLERIERARRLRGK